MPIKVSYKRSLSADASYLSPTAYHSYWGKCTYIEHTDADLLESFKIFCMLKKLVYDHWSDL